MINKINELSSDKYMQNAYNELCGKNHALENSLYWLKNI